MKAKILQLLRQGIRWSTLYNDWREHGTASKRVVLRWIAIDPDFAASVRAIVGSAGYAAIAAISAPSVVPDSQLKGRLLQDQLFAAAAAAVTELAVNRANWYVLRDGCGYLPAQLLFQGGGALSLVIHEPEIGVQYRTVVLNFTSGTVKTRLSGLTLGQR